MHQLMGKRVLLWCIAIVAVLSIGQMAPISQDMEYHNFADGQTYFDIPNIGNVLSNIPFLFVGLYGLFLYCEKRIVLSHFTGFFSTLCNDCIGLCKSRELR